MTCFSKLLTTAALLPLTTAQNLGTVAKKIEEMEDAIRGKYSDWLGEVEDIKAALQDKSQTEVQSNVDSLGIKLQTITAEVQRQAEINGRAQAEANHAAGKLEEERASFAETITVKQQEKLRGDTEKAEESERSQILNNVIKMVEEKAALGEAAGQGAAEVVGVLGECGCLKLRRCPDLIKVFYRHRGGP